MKRIRHIVLLKFKKEVPGAEIDRLFDDLQGLQGKIPGILDFAGGPYSSHEGLNSGFGHGFVMTFDSAASRDAYLPHPEHEKVKAAIIPKVDDVIAFDFEL